MAEKAKFWRVIAASVAMLDGMSINILSLSFYFTAFLVCFKSFI